MNHSTKQIVRGRVVDVINRRIFGGGVVVENGRIAGYLEEENVSGSRGFVVPGFVDAHVHVESSMVLPGEFARRAVANGTLAAIADPHEIGNVLGEEGVKSFVAQGQSFGFVWGWGIPSCVPATSFEKSGAVIDAAAVERLLTLPHVTHLGEMMNIPGVLNGDPDVMRKIRAAHALGKRVDGHAPGLCGFPLRKYIDAGIETDHESATLREVEEKLSLGMRIILRRGSAAALGEEFLPFLAKYPGMCMWCNDDIDADTLIRRGIRHSVRWALANGADFWETLAAATLTPARWYRLDLGLLQIGDRADFLHVDNLHDLDVDAAWLQGRLVAQDGQPLMQPETVAIVNHFKAEPVTADALRLALAPGTRVHVIGVHEDLIVTDRLVEDYGAPGQAKIAVVNRYEKAAPPSVGLVRGFGPMPDVAIATGISHDSHHVIGVGGSDHTLALALNAVIAQKGGIVVARGTEIVAALELPYAGLISPLPADQVAAAERTCLQAALDAGIALPSPFMTLSLLGLPVIPVLKITSSGLFDSRAGEFVPLTA